MQGHTMRVNDVAPFHPDILHPALRPTIFCPHVRVEECVAKQGSRAMRHEGE
jgi:hypothetical protein